MLVSSPSEDLRAVVSGGSRNNISDAWQCTGSKLLSTLQGGDFRTSAPELHRGAVAPSTLPDARFVSPGRGLGVRQSVGLEKVLLGPLRRDLGAKG